MTDKPDGNVELEIHRETARSFERSTELDGSELTEITPRRIGSTFFFE